MQTLVLTPTEVFFLPQRLLVPLFQRPYVWSRDAQWVLLWDDIRRQAEQRLKNTGEVASHFLGAVVLQDQSSMAGQLPRRTIIDGLQLVVIQLRTDEDSQEIFETLNARGTPLTAADLIKNFVFQRLALERAEAEKAYQD